MEMGSGRKPRQAGGYVRISDDPSEEEKGVTRQKEDVAELVLQRHSVMSSALIMADAGSCLGSSSPY
jgi:hypothetical protein